MKIALRDMTVYASAVSNLKHVAVVPEVQHALATWVKSKLGDVAPGILIGGLAMSFYAKPRETMDVDLLFLTKEQIPTTVPGFKRHRSGAFQETLTHVEVEVTTAASVGLPRAVVNQVFFTAINHDGLLVASKEAMVVLKLLGSDTLKREFKDLNDVVSILTTYPELSLAHWKKFLTPEQLAKFEDAKRRVC